MLHHAGVLQRLIRVAHQWMRVTVHHLGSIIRWPCPPCIARQQYENHDQYADGPRESLAIASAEGLRLHILLKVPSIAPLIDIICGLLLLPLSLASTLIPP